MRRIICDNKMILFIGESGIRSQRRAVISVIAVCDKIVLQGRNCDEQTGQGNEGIVREHWTAE